MPRDENGNYSLPSGNPVVTNTLITSTWANETMSDLANEMQDSLSRSGNGTLTAPIGIVAGVGGGVPGLFFQAEPTSGLRLDSNGDVRVQVTAQDNIRFLQTNRATDVWNNDLTTPAWERVFTTPTANVLDGNVEKTVQIKRETTPGAVPASLKEGELAVNVGDAPPRMYVGNTGGVDVVPFIPDDNGTIPSGATMLFEEPATAPTYWTKKTDPAYDDVAVRISTGTLTQGGTHGFTVLFDDLVEATPPGVGSHVLTIPELPAHKHGGGVHSHSLNYSGSSGNTGFAGSSMFGNQDSAGNSFMRTSGFTGVQPNIVAGTGEIINEQGQDVGHSHTFDNKLKYRTAYFAQKD